MQAHRTSTSYPFAVIVRDADMARIMAVEEVGLCSLNRRTCCYNGELAFGRDVCYQACYMCTHMDQNLEA